MHSHQGYIVLMGLFMKGLNPCFNGRCTRTRSKFYIKSSTFQVLILVLMEDALAQGTVIAPTLLPADVLILVLMEDALAPYAYDRSGDDLPCLNPCFNGRCTRTPY